MKRIASHRDASQCCVFRWRLTKDDPGGGRMKDEGSRRGINSILIEDSRRDWIRCCDEKFPKVIKN